MQSSVIFFVYIMMRHDKESKSHEMQDSKVICIINSLSHVMLMTIIVERERDIFDE